MSALFAQNLSVPILRIFMLFKITHIRSKIIKLSLMCYFYIDVTSVRLAPEPGKSSFLISQLLLVIQPLPVLELWLNQQVYVAVLSPDIVSRPLNLTFEQLKKILQFFFNNTAPTGMC